MFSTTLRPLLALSALLALTSAAPLDVIKRDGAMFTLSVNDVVDNMPGFNGSPIQARNGRFFIGGGGPEVTCPPSGPCPSNPGTVFQCVADNANTTCYLATQSGKQPIYLGTGGELLYAPAYMYGSLTPALTPFFEHSEGGFAATQFNTNPGSFMNQNWFGCSSTNTLNPEFAAPYQLFFALTAGNGCKNPAAWIELNATPVTSVEAYAYGF